MRIEDIKEELDSLGNEIQESERERERGKGRIETLMATLKDEFGVDSVEDIEPIITSTEADMNKIGKEIEKNYKELKESYDW
jgi:peptidoglycan hydrolase CwlO-like protein